MWRLALIVTFVGVPSTAAAQLDARQVPRLTLEVGGQMGWVASARMFDVGMRLGLLGRVASGLEIGIAAELAVRGTPQPTMPGEDPDGFDGWSEGGGLTCPPQSDRLGCSAGTTLATAAVTPASRPGPAGGPLALARLSLPGSRRLVPVVGLEGGVRFSSADGTHGLAGASAGLRTMIRPHVTLALDLGYRLGVGHSEPRAAAVAHSVLLSFALRLGLSR